MRYSLRTLLIVVTMLPPILASLIVEPILSAAVVGYFGTLLAILPTAAWIWRHCAYRG